MDKSQRLHIELIASDLNPREIDSSTLCPFCGGGPSKDKSFSVGVGADFGIWWKCWRLKCGESGSFTQNGACRPVSEVPDYEEERAKLTADAQIRATLHNLEDDDKNFFPILKWDGTAKGFSYRGAAGGRSTHMLSTEKGPVGGFFVCPNPKPYKATPVVIVEDPLSARAAAQFTTAYCLFGTDFSADKLDEILATFLHAELWLCLDRDATVKAAQYVIDYRLRAPNLRLMPIHRDLKHWTKDDLEEFICG